MKAKPSTNPITGEATMKTSVLIHPSGFSKPLTPRKRRNRRAGIAANQSVRTRSRQTKIPGDQIPDDRAN
jgi:hypothetical protein